MLSPQSELNILRSNQDVMKKIDAFVNVVQELKDRIEILEKQNQEILEKLSKVEKEK